MQVVLILYMLCKLDMEFKLGIWAKMGSITNTQEFISVDRKLVKVIDMLGKETSTNTNQILFFIYDNGEIEKIYINDK